MSDHGRSETFGDTQLECTVTECGNRVELDLNDRQTGKHWGPSLLMALEVHDRSLQRVERLEKYRVDRVDPVDGGVHVIIGDSYRKVSVGLWIRIRNGELEAMLPPQEVYDRDRDRCRVFAVDLLPDLLEVGPQGTLILPVGQGATCCPADKPRLADRFMIYLEQSRWEICSMLPIAGAQSPSGGLALLATEGDCDAECRIRTDGTGRGAVNFAFSLRREWPDPVDISNRR
jgi:hypothetical protein